VSTPLRFEVGDAEAGERLDSALAELAGVSRSQVQRWIETGCVAVNGRRCRASHRLALAEEVTAQPPEPVQAHVLAEAIPLSVLHCDRDLIVIDKPAGMVVHPAPGHASGTLVNALLHHCSELSGIGGVLRPGIVHRLDRGTSGVLVAAKSDLAHTGLARQFHDHSIERVYLAFVRALPGAERGEVDLPIGRHPRDRKRMSVRTRAGRAALTRWRVGARYRASRCSLLEVRPETGRTHQIRVHLAASGMPIAGDPFYGRGRRAASELAELRALARPALHAQVLGFTHPRSGESLRFEAPLPADLAGLRRALEGREEAK